MMRVALMGYRGSGKSTVGRLVASRLGAAFVDLDHAVTAAAGRSIREIFGAEGEAGFRDRESAALRDVLTGRAGVVALGGGAVLREGNRELLSAVPHRFYLSASPEALALRIAADPTTAALRPNLMPGSKGAADIDEVRRVLAVREPIYRALMTCEVDVTYRTPAEVADAICSCL